MKNFIRALVIGAIGSVPVFAGSALASCGEASWYGPGLFGNLTASGEVLSPGTMTAAHPSYRMGTRIRVTNQSNGRSVVVRINDRGPFHGGRILDLAQLPARILGVTSSGTANVCISRL